MNFILADARDWLDPRRPMCQQCAQEVAPQAGGKGCSPAPQRMTAHNDMNFGPTHEALDNLTYFEEQLPSPIQPVVRIFTLYSTGLTEARVCARHTFEGG